MQYVIDVRDVIPRDRHPMIFGQLDALVPGDVVRLVNDHDPVPLRYRLEATRPGEFTWNPIETGPEQWVIDIVGKARTIDARPMLATGQDPFELIMSTVGQLGDSEVLVIYAPFEPVPLEGVLGDMGFTYTATELAPNDWRTTFTRG